MYLVWFCGSSSAVVIVFAARAVVPLLVAGVPGGAAGLSAATGQMTVGHLLLRTCVRRGRTGDGPAAPCHYVSCDKAASAERLTMRSAIGGGGGVL